MRKRQSEQRQQGEEVGSDLLEVLLRETDVRHAKWVLVLRALCRGETTVQVDRWIVPEGLDEDSAALRLQDPCDLAERGAEIQMVEHPGAVDRVERAVAELQCLSVHDVELDASVEPTFVGAGPGLLDRDPREVERGHLAPRFREPHRNSGLGSTPEFKDHRLSGSHRDLVQEALTRRAVDRVEPVCGAVVVLKPLVVEGPLPRVAIARRALRLHRRKATTALSVHQAVLTMGAMGRRQIRVHMLIDSLGMGGAEFLLGELAAGAGAAGIEMSVGYLHEVDGDEAALRLRERGVEPIHVPVTSLVAPGGYRRLRHHLRAVAPDVVHTHLGASDAVGGLAALSLGIPAVSTVHVMEWPRTRANDLRVRLISAARRRSMARVVGVSEPAKRWLLDHRWARPEQLVTVHNGVAGVPRPGAGREIRRAHGIPDDALVVTMLSVLRAAKGHDLGIAATVGLRERVPGVHLLIVGDGPARDSLTALAGAHPGAVTIAGHRDDIMEVLDASDLLLHPSRIDALPGALLEAMAAGVPAVATDVGGIPDIIEHGVNGILVPAPATAAALREAIAPLLADTRLREALGRRARQRFELEFSLERWVERLRALYDDVLREHTNSGIRRRVESARRRA